MRVTWSVGILFLLLVTMTASPVEAAGTQKAFYRHGNYDPTASCHLTLFPPGTTCGPQKVYDPVGQFTFSDASTSGAQVSLEDDLGQPVLFKVAYGGVSKVCVSSCSVPAGSVKVMIDAPFFSAAELAQYAGVAMPTTGMIRVVFA